LERSGERSGGTAREGAKRKLIVRTPATLIGSYVGSVSDRHRVRVSKPIRSNLIFALYEAAIRSFQPFRILSKQLASVSVVFDVSIKISHLPCHTLPIN
jgi:hypothetical protein